jgi:hypothetical protein
MLPYSFTIPIPYASASAAAAALSALLALFSNKDFFLSSRIDLWLSSTPCNQYPKPAPAPPKTGYAHSDPLLKKGLISRPSCQKRTARPGRTTMISFNGKQREGFTRTPGCWYLGCSGGGWKVRTETAPEEDLGNHCESQSTDRVCVWVWRSRCPCASIAAGCAEWVVPSQLLAPASEAEVGSEAHSRRLSR